MENEESISKNAAKNEAKRQAKLQKFMAKQEKIKQQTPTSEKPKEEKVKKQEEKVQFVNTTPKGEKKNISGEMASAYNPIIVESSWYDWWTTQGFFKPTLVDGKVSPKGTYVVAGPPPNVTGSLHIGHALTSAIQDSMVRWNRMKGKTVLFMTGCDHAGIATQIVVEKQLYKETKQTRHDIGREAFLEKAWVWKKQFGDRIYKQQERLGGSYDWDRVSFTMDPKMSKAVLEAFTTLHDRKLIYRANKLVNWDCHLNTALSNLEVENKELKGRTLLSVPGHDPNRKYEFGVIISFKYAIEGSNEFLTVATTRIETMLGDTAIAVHPKDDRYTHLHGKFAIHPFSQRRIPIIADEMVDIAFGTGAVKITPAHDFNDYEVGKRHNLEFITLFNENGSVNANGGQFEGMMRFDARVAILHALKDKGLYVETKDNPMSLPTCGRSGDVIEPLLKPQWYMDCKEIARKALDAVENGDIKITPSASEKEWFRWLENIQPWCISRQLWWGHRIPAYFVQVDGESNSDTNQEFWVSGRTEGEARQKADKKFPGKKFTLEQDHDVLDTWFSSGLWPFAIMGWPDNTPDMSNFYPTTLLETGWDIIFFWVARMVMLGIALTGEVPFKEIFCHGMVCDAHGRKMSKSLGNVIDPLDVIQGISLEDLHKRLETGNLDPKEVKKAKEGQKSDFPKGIPECGTDALRFALCAYTSTGRFINLDVLRVEGYRKFCNKLWNATRFAMMKLGPDFRPLDKLKIAENVAEKWILHKLNECIHEVNKAMEEMHFMNATTAIYQFWLYELCDVYLEACKALNGSNSALQTLYTCLDAGLRLLHPFMPFVTEELFQRLPRRENDKIDSICIAAYPEMQDEWRNDAALSSMDSLIGIVKGTRSLMADYSITSNATVYVIAVKEYHSLIINETRVLLSLAKGLTIVNVLNPMDTLPAGCALYTVSPTLQVHLVVKGMVDINSELEKLNKKKTHVQSAKDFLLKKVQSADYEKVKEQVRKANQEKLNAFDAELEAIEKSLEMFLKL